MHNIVTIVNRKLAFHIPALVCALLFLALQSNSNSLRVVLQKELQTIRSKSTQKPGEEHVETVNGIQGDLGGAQGVSTLECDMP